MIFLAPDANAVKADVITAGVNAGFVEVDWASREARVVRAARVAISVAATNAWAGILTGRVAALSNQVIQNQ